MNMRYARTVGQDVQPNEDVERSGLKYAGTVTAPRLKLNLIKDALYYLHPDVAIDEKGTAQARGQLNGVVTTVMALTGKTFEETVEFIVPYLPEKIEWRCVPQPWVEAFLKHGSLQETKQLFWQKGEWTWPPKDGKE